MRLIPKCGNGDKVSDKKKDESPESSLDAVKQIREEHPILDFLAAFLPGVGEAQDVQDLYYGVKNKDYLMAGLSLLGLALPVVSGGQLRKGIKVLNDKTWVTKHTKAKTPKSYNRAKSLKQSFQNKDVEAPIPASTSGVQPAFLYIDDGVLKASDEWMPTYETMQNARTAIDVFNNYKNAMHRRRNYTWRGLRDKLFYGDAIGVKAPDNNSVLIEATATRVPNNSTIFHPTHFAPENLRKGYRLINDLAFSSQPTMFTVTDDLSPMLEKLGFVKVAQVPQYWDGQTVMKDVLLNTSTTKEAIANKLQELRYNYSEKIGIDESDINQIVEKLKNARQSFRDYPDQSTFKIKDLIKKNK